jgi:hypothetical protein
VALGKHTIEPGPHVASIAYKRQSPSLSRRPGVRRHLPTPSTARYAWTSLTAQSTSAPTDTSCARAATAACLTRTSPAAQHAGEWNAAIIAAVCYGEVSGLHIPLFCFVSIMTHSNFEHSLGHPIDPSRTKPWPGKSALSMLLIWRGYGTNPRVNSLFAGCVYPGPSPAATQSPSRPGTRLACHAPTGGASLTCHTVSSSSTRLSARLGRQSVLMRGLAATGLASGDYWRAMR